MLFRSPKLMESLLQSDIGIEKFTNRIALRKSSNKRIYPLSLIAEPRGDIGSEVSSAQAPGEP